MKTIFLALMLLSAPALAQSWIKVETNHANGLYAEGEKALFQVSVQNKPTNPDFTVKVFADGAEVPFAGGLGYFETTELIPGSPSYTFTTHLVRETPPSDVLVETQTISLTVQPNSELSR